jgi:hypothetical protein
MNQIHTDVSSLPQNNSISLQIFTEAELGILENALWKRLQRIKLDIYENEEKIKHLMVNHLGLYQKINRLWDEYNYTNKMVLKVSTQRNRILMLKKIRNPF